MKFALQPWQLMLIILAGWINRQQQEVIEYLRTENAVLKQKLGKKRILLTDEQRSVVDWQSKASDSAESLSPRLATCSHPTLFCVGIDNW